nr:reverse transcriptase domain-containing protein [Tanacetum cinerariifolium]
MFYNGLTISHRDTINTAAGGTFMQKTLEECYELIENMTAHHNHWDTLAIRDETSRNISFTSTTESPEESPPQNSPPPMVGPNGQALRTMQELCQPSNNGRGRPIASIPIHATDFGLRHHMIQQVQNTCQFHGLPSDDANRHIDKFLEITL